MSKRKNNTSATPEASEPITSPVSTDDADQLVVPETNVEVEHAPDDAVMDAMPIATVGVLAGIPAAAVDFDDQGNFLKCCPACEERFSGILDGDSATERYLDHYLVAHA